MESSIKQGILAQLAHNDKLKVFTSPAASPTGFPFKVLELEHKSLSDPEIYMLRPRVCNLGYLRTPYLQDDGKVGYRCPSEPVEDFVAKGGDKADTCVRRVSFNKSPPLNVALVHA